MMLHLDKVEREIREEIEARIEKEEKVACINAIKTCIKHCDDDKFRCVKECVGQDDYEECVNECLSTYVECLEACIDYGIKCFKYAIRR